MQPRRRVIPRSVAYLLGVLAGGLTLLLLLLAASRQSFPPTPGALTLELMFPGAAVGHVEPILCTGMYQEGNLLVVRYRDDSTVVFSYEHWGLPGIMAEPVTIRPGSRHVLRVEMPSLATYHKPPDDARAGLRIDFDGRTVLQTDVPYFGRQAKQIFFGANPIGASVDLKFHGEIRTTDGRQPSGGPETYFTRQERLSVWLPTHRWQAFGLGLVSVLVAACFSGFVQSRWLFFPLDAGRRALDAAFPNLALSRDVAPDGPVDAAERRRSLRWFAVASSIATIGYAWIVTGGTFKFNHAEVFGSFYDYQAASFLQGRLDVPEEAIGGEAFEARGKIFGYFGPTPAFLRLPFVAAGIGFGKLSRAFMVLYFVGCLVASYLLLREAVRLTLRSGAGGTLLPDPSPFASSVMVGSAGLGSTVLFLGSRGLIFHEAILAGIVFALWSCWCTLRYLNDAGRWWVGALACGVLAVHARPPTGLFALTLLGCVALTRALMAWRSRRASGSLREPVLVAALCAAGFLTLNGLAWLKFRTFDPAPLRISRPYTMPGRLEHIDGKSFHLVNIPYNIDTYFLRPNFRFEPTFPWFHLISHRPRRDFPKAKIDLPDHTLALPYAMPSLVALATFGCIGAVATRPGTRAAVFLIWLAAMPMSLALLAAVATAQRYTGDFVPFLVTAAAFGLAMVEGAARRTRAWLRAGVLVLTLAAVAANTAMTLHYQGEVLWGVPEEIRQNFQRMRQRTDRWFSAGVESRRELLFLCSREQACGPASNPARRFKLPGERSAIGRHGGGGRRIG